MSAAMEMRGVHVAYQGDIAILRGLDMTIRRGKITGIIGPNGAGKSTALKTLYGFLRPTRGEVLLDSEPTAGLMPHDFVAQGIAYVPQNRSLFDDLSVDDNIRLGCWAFRRDRPRVARVLENAYAQFPMLKDRRRERAGSLSGGQQRFLELARALVLEPKIIMLDEPTAMIAPKISQELYDFIERLPEQGITVVLVDQNVRSCVRVSDYVYILDLGRNRAEGEAAEFAGDGSLREMIAEWLDYRID
jgi:branched-chain amino acid transport system ATP-binding protein